MTFRIIPCVSLSAVAIAVSNVSTAGDPAAYNPATTYATDTDAVTVRVLDTATHLIYRSRVDGNVGHTPATSPTQWQVVGYSARWRMFDDRTSSATVNVDSIATSVTLGEAVDSAAFMQLVGQSVRLTVTDPADGLQYDQTQSLISTDGIDDYYPYCFAPIVLWNKALFIDMPPYPDATIAVTISNAGGTASCGLCKFGMSVPAGGVEWGLSMGIDDYSIKNTDEFGTTAITERDYAENMQLTAWVPVGKAGAVAQTLTALRATGAIYAETTLRDAMVYGWPESWSRTFRTLQEHVYTAQLKGLNQL